MESSSSHNETREASDYERCFQRCLLSPAFVCVRAHIVCRVELSVYPIVYACISVCMHVRVCVVDDDSTPGVPSAGAPR